MRLENTLISLIALLLGFLLLFMGIVLLIPFTADRVGLLLAENLRPFGYLFVSFALLLLSAFTLLCKRRYFLVRMGTSLQDRVLSKIAYKNIAELFPLSDEIRCSSLIHRNQKIEILLNLPYVRPEERERVLQEIEEKLKYSFAHDLGYKKEFLLNVSFHKN